MSAPDASVVDRERVKFYRSVRGLISLVVFLIVVAVVFFVPFSNCKGCAGIGKLSLWGTKVPICEWCGGDGKVNLWKSFRQVNVNRPQEKVKCGTCNGTGYPGKSVIMCSDCLGSGVKKE
jgi:DnaJ-class molecular chaperone